MTVNYSGTGTGCTLANNGGNAGSGNLSWTHTGTAGAYGLVFVTGFNGSPTGVTFGGLAMTQLASVLLNNNAANGNLSVWARANIPGSAQTVAVTVSGSAAYVAQSCSFLGATNATTSTVYGSGQQASQSLTCSLGQIIVCGLAVTGNPFTGVGGGNFLCCGTDGNINGLAIGMSQSSTTFTANVNGTQAWGCIGVVLS